MLFLSLAGHVCGTLQCCTIPCLSHQSSLSCTKEDTGGLVFRWVITGEYLALYVFDFFVRVWSDKEDNYFCLPRRLSKSK
jgi:hypothetical protein